MTEQINYKSDDIRHKIVRFEVSETLETKENGANIGIIKGFASTYDNVDRGGDVIRRGAFNQSIKRHEDDKRPVRMFFQHNNMFPIGMFPIDQVSDNEKGLFVVGHINLDADKGASTYALVKQGAISDMSIGYSINKAFTDAEGAFNLTDINLWEISLVSEPMNPEATILEVKSADKLETIRDVEHFLKSKSSLSAYEVKTIISKIKSISRDVKYDEDNQRDAESKREENVAEKISEKLFQHDVTKKLSQLNQLLKRK